MALVTPVGESYNKPSDITLDLYKISWKSSYQQGVYDRVNVSYRKTEELIETLFKSSYIPILVDGNVTYQNCVDGFNPTLFNERTEEDRKGLFIHLLSYEKMFTAFNVRNDKNTTFRAIEGINEIHKFFLGQYTPLCSYVNEWSYRQLLTYRIRQIIYYMVIYIIRLLVISKALIPDEFYETPIWNLVSQMGSKIYKDIFFQICF